MISRPAADAGRRIAVLTGASNDQVVPIARLVQAALDESTAEIERLRAAIQDTLADEESRPGGWGPDITCVLRLKAALGEPS